MIRTSTPLTTIADLKSLISKLSVKRFQIEPYDKSANKGIHTDLDKFYSSNSKGIVIFIEER